MNHKSSLLSFSSLITAGLAFLAIPIGMSFVMPQDVFRTFYLIALLAAMTSVMLGVAGIVKTRHAKLASCVPAMLGIGVGGVLTVLYALICWLSTPF